jgi:hypothetical protein
VPTEEQVPEVLQDAPYGLKDAPGHGSAFW